MYVITCVIYSIEINAVHYTLAVPTLQLLYIFTYGTHRIVLFGVCKIIRYVE